MDMRGFSNTLEAFYILLQQQSQLVSVKGQYLLLGE